MEEGHSTMMKVQEVQFSEVEALGVKLHVWGEATGTQEVLTGKSRVEGFKEIINQLKFTNSEEHKLV